MVDVSACVEFDQDGSGLSSMQQSDGSSPFLLEVPPTIHTNEFLPAVDTIVLPSQVNASEDPQSGRHDDQPEDSDIYRGEQIPTVTRPLGGDEVSVASSSSSSSSSSLNVGRRLGALANVVETAIARWARTHSSASSTTSSSSASSSIRTHTTRRPKGRRYSSSASIHNAAHERALFARKRAHEEFRVVPREFTLLLPSDSNSVFDDSHSPDVISENEKDRRIVRTGSLPLILSRLDSALKTSAKSNRAANKGKGKSLAADQQATTSTSNITKGTTSPKCWWLDVASPSWDDLRSIGKLLHLHPLTLEDILHRDPREKLELFPRLGYYFIVFRALEGERSRERFRQLKVQNSDRMENLSPSSADESVVGAVNVYIIVFSEGICSFHFEDISEHTDKLRNRILQIQHSFGMTSDWIAHGLMDSIVDSFFPILLSIDKEIKEVDRLVLEGQRSASAPIADASPLPAQASDSGSLTEINDEKGSSEQLKASTEGKGLTAEKRTSFLPLNIRISESRFNSVRHVKRSIQRVFEKRRSKTSVENPESIATTTFKTLVKIAVTRRIVTSLGRLLGTKGEVVAQIRKRLILVSVDTRNNGLGLRTSIDGEIAIYMGDIQDHIATLQQALNHYERMLSHSHPAYLSQLRVTQSLTKGGTDKAILILTAVSITVVSIQVLLGLFSMNVQVPNSEGSAHPFSVYFSILAATLIIGTSIIALLRFWHVQAKKKYSRNL